MFLIFLLPGKKMTESIERMSNWKHLVQYEMSLWSHQIWVRLEMCIGTNTLTLPKSPTSQNKANNITSKTKQVKFNPQFWYFYSYLIWQYPSFHVSLIPRRTVIPTLETNKQDSTPAVLTIGYWNEKNLVLV